MFTAHDPDLRRCLLAFGVTEMDLALLSQRRPEIDPAMTLGILNLRHQLSDWPEMLPAIADPNFFSVMTAHWFLLIGAAFDRSYRKSAEDVSAMLIRANMPVHGVALVSAQIAAETIRIIAAKTGASAASASLHPAISGALRKLSWLDSAFIQGIYWRRGQDVRQKTEELEDLAGRLSGLVQTLAGSSRALSNSLQQVSVAGRAVSSAAP